MTRTIKITPVLVRIVRWYRIIRGSASFENKVTVAWQEKEVPDPDNDWHFRHSKGWKRRQRTITVEDLDRRFSKVPPKTT
jgi:hypothetical protein